MTKKPVLLHSFSIFKGLDDAALQKILATTVTQDYEAGEFIFREGSSGDVFYIVLSGTLEVLKTGEKNALDKIAERRAGDFFGEMSLFDEQPRSASLRAATKATLLEIRYAHFNRLITSQPTVAFQILKSVASRLRESDTKLIEELERNKAMQERQIEKLKSETTELRAELSTRYTFENVLGNSTAMKAVLEDVAKFAGTSSNVLVEGESGTGKEVIARLIHYNSPRRSGKFIAVDCGSLSESLLESELFGHKKGSFTGASEDKTGLFEEAEGGTIFLDEITNTSLSLQARLLRVIQEKEVRRIGETKTRKVDIRIISATNRNIKRDVTAKTFREDLYYRLNVISVKLPPLRDRRDDIGDLAMFFVKKFSLENKKPVKDISPVALAALLQYDWPGNIRELENTIERAVILSKHDELVLKDLPPEMIQGLELLEPELKSEKSSAFEEQVKSFKRLIVRKALSDADGNKTKAAENLGLQRTYFFQVLKQLGLSN